MRVAIDTWAFREIVAATPRGLEAAAVLAEADFAFTTRECVVETFNAIQRTTRRSRSAWAWWDELRAGQVRVFEPRLDEVRAYALEKGPELGLSLADWSLALAAARERTTTIATEDAEFRRIGLEPLFAR